MNAHRDYTTSEDVERMLAGYPPLRWGRADGVPVPRAAVVAEALSWVDTPFLHQHHVKGHGCDCGGLARGVSIELGLIPADYRSMVPQELLAYRGRPTSDRLAQALCDYWWQRIERSAMQPGDVVLVAWGSLPQHTVILTDRATVVHAIGPVHPNKVIESPLRWLTSSTARTAPRIVQAYHLPGVES